MSVYLYAYVLYTRDLRENTFSVFVHSSVRSDPVVPSCIALSALVFARLHGDTHEPVEGKSGHTALSSCFHNSARIIQPSLCTVTAH